MIVGTLKEIKSNEARVALTPEGAARFAAAGHHVLIEHYAGSGSGMSDEQYRSAGAEIVFSKNDICDRAELILKVKEPIEEEYQLFRPGQILFTFFHFASNRRLTEAMVAAGTTCIAYETVTNSRGQVPLLAPMSEIAGKMAPLVAANFLSTTAGGKGVLVSPVTGGTPASFIIIGGGTAGCAAAQVSLGIGAAVTIFDVSHERIVQLADMFHEAQCLLYDPETVEGFLSGADAAVGAVHVPGMRAARVVSRKAVSRMEKGSVIVDIAIDQGGCFETSRPTSHARPTYVEEGVIHYCVTNMPGIFPRTATLALTRLTLPLALEIAQKGAAACREQVLQGGLNIYCGTVTHPGVAEAHGMPFVDPSDVSGLG